MVQCNIEFDKSRAPSISRRTCINIEDVLHDTMKHDSSSSEGGKINEVDRGWDRDGKERGRGSTEPRGNPVSRRIDDLCRGKRCDKRMPMV